jgi:hypothetical protein
VLSLPSAGAAASKVAANCCAGVLLTAWKATAGCGVVRVALSAIRTALEDTNRMSVRLATPIEMRRMIISFACGRDHAVHREWLLLLAG